MNREKAKEILYAYNPQLGTLDDPELEKALQLLEEDPALTDWLEEEQAFDKVFSEKLHSISPPDDLREKILHYKDQETSIEEKGAVDAQPEYNSPVVAFPWWRRTSIWAAAACIFLLLSIGSFLLRNPAQPTPPALARSSDFTQLVDDIAEHSSNFIRLQYKNKDVSEIRTYLTKNKSPVPGAIPEGIGNMPGVGCLSFSWEGKPLSLICFRGEEIYHLYVGNKADFGKLATPLTASPTFRQIGSNSTASWASNDKVYILTVAGEKKDLNKFLW